jgi:hypothetical protein
VKHHPAAAGADVGAVAAQLLGLGAHPAADLLELGAGLAGGGDGGQLAVALLELAAPGAVEAHVAVPVELLEERQGRDHTVAGPVVGGEDLDPAVVPEAGDPPVAVVDAEALLEAARPADEARGLVVEDLTLISRGGPLDDHRVRGVVAVIEGEAPHKGRLAVALGDDEPHLRDAGEEILGDRQLEVLRLPVGAVIEDQVPRIGAEMVDGERT